LPHRNRIISVVQLTAGGNWADGIGIGIGFGFGVLTVYWSYSYCIAITLHYRTYAYIGKEE